MAATEHFKAAAQAIANARQEKQREIDELRASLNHQEIDVRHSVQGTNTQIRTLEANMAQLARTDSSSEIDRERTRILQNISVLRRTMTNTESDFGRTRQRILDRIRQMEQEIIGLDSLIRDLESRR